MSSRTARHRLPPRREPYFRTIQKGQAIGYRRLSGQQAGTWIARIYDPVRGRKHRALGSADDEANSEKTGALTFAQAQDAARAWFAVAFEEPDTEKPAAPKTVGDAIEHYLTDYARRGGKASAPLEITINAHILPTLGDLRLADLKAPALRAWLADIAKAPPRRRLAKKKGAKAPEVGLAERKSDPDRERARRASANRVLTVLKAALNLAYRDGWTSTDEAWRRVQPYQRVDAPKISFLDDVEATRLANACAPDFRTLVVAALLTGARYGELTTIRAGDLDLRASTLHIPRSKSGKARYVHLTSEGLRFFTDLTAGRTKDSLVLVRSEGQPWGKSHQCRPLASACRAASITPAISFHVLRHTYASRLARSGTPMLVIAAQLGHADTRITSRHYAHLAPDHVAAAVKAGFTDMGLHAQGNVTQSAPRAGSAG